jgi:hypothetical protein
MADESASWDRLRPTHDVLRGSLVGERSEHPTATRVSRSEIVDIPHAQAEDPPDPQPLSHSSRPVTGRFWPMLLIVWGFSVAYMAMDLKRGWVAHDEGAFAQSAERVLNGELPHRDFDEIYTGGLAFANALAFRVFGTNLASMRFVLFAFFVAWVPAVFYIASRFVSPNASAGVTLLAVAWSVPNYSAAVPSWYNLFFAAFGTAALLRYIEVSTRRWLFLAGLCAGLSIAIKIIGLYFVAAVVLFLVFREQSLASDRKGESRTVTTFYSAAILVGCVIFALLLTGMILRGPSLTGIIYFVLPVCALLALLVSREFTLPSSQSRNRLASFFKLLLPFLAGTAIPIAILLIPYVLSGSVPWLIRGIFVLPTRRFSFAMFRPPDLGKMLKLVPIALLVAYSYYARGKAQILCGLILTLYLTIVFQLSAYNDEAYGIGWFSILTAIPAIVAIAALYLGVPRFAMKLGPERQQQLMLLFSVLAMTSLVQFPFSAPIYFCYVAPVLVLATAALFSLIPRPPHLALGALMIFYLLFAVARVTPGFIYNMGFSAAPDSETQPLKLARAGNLRVEPNRAAVYEELIPFIQAHASGEFIYAGADCPEIYFFTALKNPTRTLVDSFDEPEGRTQRILDAIETHHITVLAFNETPSFAGTINRELEQAVKSSFPQSKQIGNFRVRWRE